MYNFKIDKIITKSKEIIIPKKINIVIGPNNCGKSQFLKDIKNILYEEPSMNIKSIIIEEMQYNLPSSKEEFIERYNIEDHIFRANGNQYYIRNYSGLNDMHFNFDSSFNSYLDTGNINIQDNWLEELERQVKRFYEAITNNEEILSGGNFSEKAVIHNETYVVDEIDGQKVRTNIGGGGGPLWSQPGEGITQFINKYGRIFFNYLGTEEKLLMSKIQKKYGLQDGNTNFLSQVQFNSKLLKLLANYTKKMFNLDIYLDRFSFGDKILFRVGDDFAFIRDSDREDSDAEQKLALYKMLDNEGDGIKSFVTNFLALNLNDKNILLLDEPESFLHPPLAKQLGEIIGKAATDDKQIFISTHSVDMLKGILNSCDDVNIIRITREGNQNFINQIDKSKIGNIVSSPLLSSANVLNGLFCEKVYICESESDEEFYKCLHDKVNLLDSSFFVHGKNKQTLKDIASIYNELKIPNHRIYDFDLLKDEDFNKSLNGFIDNGVKDKYIEIRKKINNNISDKDDYQSKGVRGITNKQLIINVNSMLKELKNYGIIVLKNGCLETNFEDKQIPYTLNKNKWFVDAINYIATTSTNDIKNSYIYKWIYE